MTLPGKKNEQIALHKIAWSKAMGNVILRFQALLIR